MEIFLVILPRKFAPLDVALYQPLVEPQRVEEKTEFFIRFPRRLSEWIMITIGGLLMGIGIRLAFVCNVSTFFGLTPQLNLGGYLAISGIIAGAWVGSLIYKKSLGL